MNISTPETPESTGKRKPRTCPHCKRHFRRHEHLQRHIRIHTNEKPYKCTCGASFGRRDLLKRHEDIGHSPTPPTQQVSPMTGHSNQNLQSPLNNVSTGNSDTSFWGVPDLQGVAMPTPIDSEGQFPSYQFEGSPPLAIICGA
ncbi:uncharacterized protein N7511_010884 [Penicillium nucicola]|uniref:uncharacterized protein n=1 Tax=Penicillium nucicola TaxID=1850975 RepID=UPI0025450948|nr:uncharacterized protein N7511_010884 [Penicillium nucicola]KAJ5749188.1 hypothetical protein N7511_010884 [Penicillium nucicola]